MVAVGWLFSGPATAGYPEGVMALESGNFRAAVTEFEPLAAKGHADAQYRLGRMYDNGWGVQRDRRKAAEYYRLAGNKGHANAQARLGVAHFNGEGAVQNYGEAYKWLAKAAEQGHPDSMYYVGYMILKELGGQSRDYVVAHKWFNLSVVLGSQLRAATYRRTLRRLMDPAQKARARQLAQEWMDSHPVKLN